MRRSLVIEEEFGIYHVKGLWNGTGRTLETALNKAVEAATGDGIEVHSSHEMAVVLEELLGESRDNYDGPVAA